MMHRLTLVILVMFILTSTTFAEYSDSGFQQKIDFNRDIRPILSDNCFQCHGPDEAARAADLRLDSPEIAHESAFVPGSLDDSEAWQRILSDDEDSVMPPPESHKQLDEKQKELLKAWIQAGAKYQKHWAFRKISKPSIPRSENPRFAQSIDAFVYQAMKSQGLSPSPPAERYSLIRRVTLDLTGLPPSRNEVQEFLNDESHDAFEKVVDRLLNSKHFGERMAVDWMDVARYGDTSVFHADGPRNMWRWRDWVVASFNNNMPFDDFTVKQLAGDLLPNASIDDQVASGFNRNNASTDEGGAIAEEFRVEYAVDRVKTTSMVWMGLSMECAQCHDHKYDPISQKDYYRFFAFFNQAADPGMQTRRGNQSPIVNIPDTEKLAKLPEVETQLQQTQKELAQLRELQLAKVDKWLSSQTSQPASQPPQDTTSYFQFEKLKPELVNQSNSKDQVKLHGKPKLEAGKLGKALRTTNQNYASSTLTGANFDGDSEISYGCWVKLNGRSVGAPLARMDEGQSFVGFDLFLQNDGVAAHFIHRWPDDAVKVIAKTKLAPKKWVHLFVTYDGSKSADGIRIYVDGQHVASKPSHNNLKGSTKTTTPFTIGRRKSTSQFNGWVDDVRVYNRKLSDSEVALLANADPLPDLLAIASDKRTKEQNDQIFEIYLDRQVPKHAKLKKQIGRLNAKIAQLKKPLTSVMVMKDVAKPRMTFVLERGQYDAPNKEKPVQPGVPNFLPAFDGKYPANRLGMAQWLTADEHPLTARVTVNRIWKMFMGNGLVESIEDFGLQSTWPSHPQLLDWLAADFVENQWNMKRLIKMIVMSESYQQTSAVTKEQLKSDPLNRFLSRGPRFRLSGEFLRDQALAISGLLNPKLGGPGVKPYQPPGLWNEVSLDGGLRFRRDSGDKLYRRSLYTYWKRSSPPPNMVIFDAPTREKCTVRRGKTNTPLQALVLLNDPQFVEAAKMFAQKILRDGGETTEQRITFAFQQALARDPTTEEVTVLSRLMESELSEFQSHPDKAKQLLEVGEKKTNPEFEKTTLAAWTVLTNLIFNLDEFITRG